MSALSLSFSLSLSLSIYLLFFFLGGDPLAPGPCLLLPSICDEVYFILIKGKRGRMFLIVISSMDVCYVLA